MRRRTTEMAKSLRRRMSLPEVLLWRELKGGDPAFRRQIPQGSYVLDFYCAGARLAIEVDGAHHETTSEHDARRNVELAQAGITVRRVAAREVLADPGTIAAFCRMLAAEIIDSRRAPY